ncbi:hypothetical protein [Streptomyces sp. NPDC054958]
MAARFGDGSLLQEAVGEHLGQGDGFWIGDQVAGGHPPQAVIETGRPDRIEAGGPQLFFHGPGLVPPRPGHRSGDLECLHASGGAAQKPDMPPLGLDDLHAPAKGHEQTTASGQVQQPVPVA